MIITVDPSQSEDIAAFAMVKQYRLQALKVTLNGGTGSGAWQPVQDGEGYTQTVVSPVTGIELVYEDPNAIVSYTVENDDTSNYDAASDAGIILSSIEPTDNAWTYTCVFHADSAPVSSVDIDLLVYGNVARGTEQQGSPATAEEITAQVLAGLETRVLALENEMPDKADKSTTYTKAEADTLLAGYVTLNTAQTIPGAKTFTRELTNVATNNFSRVYTVRQSVLTEGATPNETKVFWPLIVANQDTSKYPFRIALTEEATTGRTYASLQVDNPVDNTICRLDITKPTNGIGTLNLYNGATWSAVATVETLDSYAPMVRTTGNQEILGLKTMESLSIGSEFNNKSTVTQFDADTSKYCRMYTYNDSTGAQYKTFMVMITPKRLNIGRTGLLYFGDNRNASPVIGWLLKGSAIPDTDFVITKEADGTINLWCKTYTGAADGYHGIRILEHTTSGLSSGYLQTVVNEEGYAITSSGYTDKDGIVHTFTHYVTPS